MSEKPYPLWYFCLVEIAVLEVSCLRGAFTERRNVFVDIGRTWGIYVSTCCVALDHNSTTPLRHREQDLRFGCVWRSRKDRISVVTYSARSSCLWLRRERLIIQVSYTMHNSMTRSTYCWFVFLCSLSFLSMTCRWHTFAHRFQKYLLWQVIYQAFLQLFSFSFGWIFYT